MNFSAGFCELSQEEQFAVCGGDWFERYFGFMVTMAFLGGALAAPPLLAAAGMAGAALLVTDHFAPVQ